ncbi:hypothetical protein MWU61_07120 [Loktanella sp. F6476L]|uniref:hypothetical protein n=1 Tax=Loktanella sp. F6476L TaxID=2926405 RepID=UPI001FF26C14|nr:hypothetical protein [Loktanella sp. F6476L]MCK0120305.1 hypothetical protein [Loktanella sp. F6476L]
MAHTDCDTSDRIVQPIDAVSAIVLTVLTAIVAIGIYAYTTDMFINDQLNTGEDMIVDLPGLE